MDRVRFGRALGGGARDAARAILRAADAAAAPSPTPARSAPAPVTTTPPGPAPARSPARSPSQSPSQSAVQSPARSQPIPAPTRLAQGSRRFGQALWAPLARQSGVLWLEFTGVFFGLFAVTAGLAAFKHRHDLLTATPARPQALFALAMFLVFAWFTVSSFVKASRRSRG